MGVLKLLGNGHHTRTHHKFPEPRKSYSPGFPGTGSPPHFHLASCFSHAKLIPKKAPIFSTYITDFRTRSFSSLLELSIFCHMTLIAFAVPLSLSLSCSCSLFRTPLPQLHAVSPTTLCISRIRCLCAYECCESNKTKKYSAEI